MPVHQPGRRLFGGIPLPFVQKKVSNGGRRQVGASLSLTSMIDFLVVTVVFLLMTFDSSEANTLQKTMHVPSAENVVDMIDAPVVVVTGSMILTDGTLTGNTREIENGKTVQRIDELTTYLRSVHDKWKQIHPEKDFPGVVVLGVDQDVPALVVKSVFQTAALAGYPNIGFMVSPIGVTPSAATF